MTFQLDTHKDADDNLTSILCPCGGLYSRTKFMSKDGEFFSRYKCERCDHVVTGSRPLPWCLTP